MLNVEANLQQKTQSIATLLKIDNGSACAQLFVGTKTIITDVYGMKSDEQFVNSLEDSIRQRGVMAKLMSDSA